MESSSFERVQHGWNRMHREAQPPMLLQLKFLEEERRGNQSIFAGDGGVPSLLELETKVVVTNEVKGFGAITMLFHV